MIKKYFIVTICGVFSLVVFVLSVAAHLSTFVPSISLSILDQASPLHFASMAAAGAMIFFYVAQLNQQPIEPAEVRCAERRAGMIRANDYNSKVLSIVPLPLKIFCVCSFFYALVNFAGMIERGEGGNPAYKYGQYYLQSHGHKIRDISKNEYELFRTYKARSSSGFWMSGSLFSTVFLLLVYPRIEKMQELEMKESNQPEPKMDF